MEQTVNQITLCGTPCAAPVLSHENHGKCFYRFPLAVPRLSGTTDTLQVLAPPQLLADVHPGCCIQVCGQIRSFNRRTEQGRKLLISVFAELITPCGAEAANDVHLLGVICKPPVFRRTPLGREICDIMLAVNRAYSRTDYLPCIVWGRTAQEVARLPVGTPLSLSGRLQSRTYIKQLETGREERIAYEISALTAAPFCI